MKKVCQKQARIDFKRVCKYINVIPLITMIILIYVASPHITASIQNGAKYIYELESTYITRVVELVLSVTLVAAIFIGKEKLNDKGSNN